MTWIELTNTGGTLVSIMFAKMKIFKAFEHENTHQFGHKMTNINYHVGLLEVDVPLRLFLLALLGGLALNQSHPDHGEHEDQGGEEKGFL